jgi:hypothetical protein
MRYRVGVYAGLLVALFFYSTSVHAAEFETKTLRECREHSKNDPTIVMKVSIPPHKECGKADGARYAQDDEWLGLRLWLNPRGGVRAKEVIEPQRDVEVIDNGSYKACSVTAEDASYVTEWFVPVEISCAEGRGPVARQYFAGKVCLIPRDICFDADKLSKLADQRVHNSIENAKKKAQEEREKKYHEARLNE